MKLPPEGEAGREAIAKLVPEAIQQLKHMLSAEKLPRNASTKLNLILSVLNRGGVPAINSTELSTPGDNQLVVTIHRMLPAKE